MKIVDYVDLIITYFKRSRVEGFDRRLYGYPYLMNLTSL